MSKSIDFDIVSSIRIIPERRRADDIELYKIKPDLRMFGFNNPSPKGNEIYGYEYWVTIPYSKIIQLDLLIPIKVKNQSLEG